MARPVEGDGQVGLELVAAGRDKATEVRGAGLLLAVEDDTEVQPGFVPVARNASTAPSRAMIGPLSSDAEQA